MTDVFDSLDTPKPDIFDEVASPSQKSSIDKFFDVLKAPSPAFLQPAERFIRIPLVSPETIAPFLQAPQGLPNLQALRQGKIETPAEPPVIASPIGQGIAQGVGEAASQFTSPGNLALLPLIPEGAIGKVVAGGFAAQGLAQYPELYRRFQSTDDPKEKARILATAAVLAAPAAGLFPRGSGGKTLLSPQNTLDSLMPDIPIARVIPPSSAVPTATELTSESLPQPNVPEGYARFQQPTEQLPPQTEQLISEAEQAQPAPSNQEQTTVAQPEPMQIVAGTQGAEEQGAAIWDNMSRDERWDFLKDTLDPFDLALNRKERYAVTAKSWNEIQSSTKDILANKLVQTQPKEVTENAIEKGNITESSQPEYTGNAPSGTPAETGGRGGTEPETAVTETGPVEEPPKTTGVANRVLQAESEAGRFEEIQPGEGMSAEEMIALGREELNRGVDPQAVANRFKRTKEISPRGFAVLRAQRENLFAETNRLEDAYKAVPTSQGKEALEAARKAESDWVRNIVQPAKTKVSDIFRGMQQEAPVDVSTFAGMRRAVEDLHGEQVKPEQAPRLRQAAKRVQDAAGAETRALQKLAGAVERGRRTQARSVEELRDHLAERMKQITPC